MVSIKSINLESINKANRIVLKVGSSLIVNPNTGYINNSWVENLAQDILFLLSKNKEILIVSSGAVALGKTELNLQNKSLKLSEKQAAAAAGQIVLAKSWKNVFEKNMLPNMFMKNVTQNMLCSNFFENEYFYEIF